MSEFVNLFGNEKVLSLSSEPIVRELYKQIKEKDSDLAQHSLRDAFLASVLIAITREEEEKLRNEEIRTIYKPLTAEDEQVIFLGGLLHDVGKVANEYIIGLVHTPGEWSPEFRLSVGFLHVYLGLKIAEQAGLPDNIKNIIRSHHEQWDGKGYPDNLEGNNIPILAAAFKVIDEYDAMTTRNDQRPARTP